MCSTWIPAFLSAFHSHSLARSLCHCHARSLSHSLHPFLFSSSPSHPRSICLPPSLPPSPSLLSLRSPFVQLLFLSSAWVFFALVLSFLSSWLESLGSFKNPEKYLEHKEMWLLNVFLISHVILLLSNIVPKVFC